MNKIKERRKRTATTEIENRAVLAEGVGKKEKSPLKTVFVVLVAIVAVVALALLIINAVVDSYSSKFPESNFHGAVANVNSVDEMALYEDESFAKLYERADIKKAYLTALKNYAGASSSIVSDDSVYNFVVAGINNDAETDLEKVALIVLVSINTETNKASYYTLTKTTLVYIPSVGVGPLYHAFSWGDTGLLARTVEENYGVAINGYINVNFNGFISFADELGGVTIDGTTYAGNDLIPYVQNSANRDEAIKKLTNAMVPSMLKAGIMKCFNLLDENIGGSIARDDLGVLFKNASALSAEADNSITIGIDNHTYLGVGMTTCDLVAQRAILVNSIYPTK